MDEELKLSPYRQSTNNMLSIRGKRGLTLFFSAAADKRKKCVCPPFPGSHFYARFHAKLPLGHVPATPEQQVPYKLTTTQLVALWGIVWVTHEMSYRLLTQKLRSQINDPDTTFKPVSNAPHNKS